MKPDVLKTISKAQFAKACRENKTIIGVCRAFKITPSNAHRLERVYQIDLPRNQHGSRKFDHDEIYDTFLKNDLHAVTTAKIIGCSINTVSRIVKKREEGDKYTGR